MRKVTLIVSLILAMGLAASASADLVLHWGLDEASGTTAYDSVGANHGTLVGNTVWAPAGGKFGGAALFDGTDDSIRVTAPEGPFPVSDYPFTLMAWVKSTKTSAKAVALAVVKAPFEYYWIGLNGGRPCVASRDPGGMWEQIGGSASANDQWHHLCGVFYGPADRRLYADGVEVTKDTRATPFITGIRRVAVGALDRDPAGTNIVDEMLGSVDDVAIFSEALELATIKDYMTNGIPTASGAASQPSPADGTTDVPFDTELIWLPGESAATHDVYLGTTFESVEAATAADPLDVLVSQGQTDAAYAPDSPLEYGQTYYWRVDEIAADGTSFKSPIWSFTVEPFAYPITGVTATASSSTANMGPEKVVDGSGLTGDLHSVEPDAMWLSSATETQPAWIQFEFDKVYKLGEMWVWNSNQLIEAFVGFGAKSVAVEYSVDGSTWTALADVPEFAQGAGLKDYAHNTTVAFGGVQAKYVRLTIGSSWGTLQQYGLGEVRFFSVPVQARLPEPADAETGVSVDVELNWRPGREATSHKVYLGADQAAVADGSAPAETVAEHTYAPASLGFGSTYYWKVDEVGDAGTYPGEVWSFTTREYAAIDDFESYDDEDNRIYQAWVDGLTTQASGSQVGYDVSPFAERTIVHGGGQSMPLLYDNTVLPFVSEAERAFATAQNWTTNGADTLSLYVRGSTPAFAETASGSILMNGIGADIWGTADQFRYAYKTLNGNGTMIARVDSLFNSNAWAKGGVMIRQSIEPGSVHAFMPITPGGSSGGNGASFQRRLVASQASTNNDNTGAVVAAPYWVKVERMGDQFTGAISPDGTTWTQLGTAQTIPMTGPVLIGLALCSHDASNATGAEFSNISTTGNVTGAWQVAEIGAEQPAGNSVEGMYVTIEDSSGKSRTVVHPDPAATVRAGWVQWRIPLSEFTSAGVKMNAVKSMTIGVGNQGAPVKGGTGKLFIDDIGYGRPAAGQ